MNTNGTESTGKNGEDEKSVGDKTYRKFLETIRANVGGVQPPMAAKSSISIIFCGYNGHTPKTMRNAIIVGRDQRDDIIEWVDETGEARIGLQLSAYDEIAGRFPFDKDDVDAIQEIIQTETSREQLDQDVVGWANTQIMEIESRCDEDGDGDGSKNDDSGAKDAQTVSVSEDISQGEGE